MSEMSLKSSRTGLEIAVIGMAGKFPGANNIDEFWCNLRNGIETISFFSDDELSNEGINLDIIKDTDYVKARGILEDIERFDALFFDYTPKDAELMDPQLRVFHECCWEALENAGCDPEAHNGLIGLYAGASPNFSWVAYSYLFHSKGSSAMLEELSFTDKDYLSMRVSYNFNLTGPSLSIRTTCSTSLVAIHLAFQGLISGECDMALAGGVTIKLPQRNGYMYRDGMVNSRDGHCRAFDSKATGTIGGEGIGIVVLKRLEEAISGRDNILAIIKGSAINNDGNRKVGYTAPSVEGQVEVIKAALQVAEVEPESISYIEAHGTGTTLGDPIEIEALKRAFGSDIKGFCGIGSVKSNIGHLDSAAGVASFIKTVLSLKFHLIPPSVHSETPAPKIDFKNSPFYVNDTLKSWKSNTYPLRAGVSSFGIGGTNAHVILEEAPPGEESSGSRPFQLIILSAKTDTALGQAAINLAGYLDGNPGSKLADVAYTLQLGRRKFKHRKIWVCSNHSEAISSLTSKGGGKAQEFAAEGRDMPIVFMFPGQGSQYVNMGSELYREEPEFREEMDQCFRILRPILGYDIKNILYPTAYVENDRNEINHIDKAPLVNFILEYSLARFLIKLGIKPYAMIGHSLGEYVAACLAGVFSLADALNLTASRGRLMKQLPPGVMMSIPLPEKKLRPFLTKEISVAADHGMSCIVSGSDEAITALEKNMKQNKCICQRLSITHAGHSMVMDSVLDTFKAEMSGINLKEPQIPYISNVTGNWITVEEATSPQYWADHMRETVRFSQGIKRVIKERKALFVEAGAGNVLSTIAFQYIDEGEKYSVINLLRYPEQRVSDIKFLLNKIGRIWLYGGKIDWSGLYTHEKRNRIPLPTYPFEGQDYSVNVTGLREALTGKLKVSQGESEDKEADIADWFYIPSWKPSLLSPPFHPGSSNGQRYLLFLDESRFGTRLTEQLAEDHDVIIVKKGTNFTVDDRGHYSINPNRHEHYDDLLKELSKRGAVPERVVHLWSITGESYGVEPILERLEEIKESGYYSLLYFVQALGRLHNDNEIHITVLTNGIQTVPGELLSYPEKAILMGPVQTIPLEFPNIDCRVIDIVLPEHGNDREDLLLSNIQREFSTTSLDTIIAYRGHHRLALVYEPFRLEGNAGESFRLKKKGTYLLTGGLGGIGLVLAEYLTEKVQGALILTCRSDIPDRKQWHTWVSTHSDQDLVSHRIKKIWNLEARGAEVWVLQADVSSKQQMLNVIKQVERKFGSINGVIHCAGIAGGDLIQRKTRERTDHIFAPKVKGTLVLEEVLGIESLDFFILCSSLNSILPGIGLVDYCAANAFIDAYVQYKSSTSSCFITGINWDAWKEVGGAVEAVKRLTGSLDILVGQGPEVSHPLVGKCISNDGNLEVYANVFNVEKNWEMSEHRILGKATLVGTAFLEMARAAFERHSAGRTVEIEDVYFLSPFLLQDNEEREVRTILRKQDTGYEFSIVSRMKPGEDGWQEHARGKITTIEKQELHKVVLKEIETKCDKGEIFIKKDEKISTGALVEFGPRWNCCRKVKIGDGLALSTLELNERFEDDLESYWLHPALMDAAVAARLADDNRRYLPFSYKRLLIKGPLPSKIRSYLRLVKNQTSTAKGFRCYDITIMDEEGVELVNIEEYMLRTVSKKETLDRQSEKGADYLYRQSSFLGNTGPVSVRQSAEATGDGGSGKQLPGGFLENGILNTEGVEVFKRIIAGVPGQLIISTTNLNRRLERKKTSEISAHEKNFEELNRVKKKSKRPQLSTMYVPPQNEVEQRLTHVYQKFFGFDEVGIHDDFFELGGNSVKAVVAASLIHKELGIKVAVSDIFSMPTIGELAKFVRVKNKSVFSPIEMAEKKEFYELSMAQRRMFLFDQLDPGNKSYNIPIALRLEGQLERKRLEESFIKMIGSHESLRTSFDLLNGLPVQTIHEYVPFSLEYFESDEEGSRKIIHDFIAPFDLTNAPILRSGLVKIKERRHIIIIDVHHIIADATSLTIFLSELISIYKGDNVTGLRIQYKDFCEWQSREDRKGRFEEQEKFWLSKFDGVLPQTEIPIDFPRPARQAFEGRNRSFILDDEDLEVLKIVTKSEEVTLFMMMLAIFNVLLAKVIGQEDIVVASPTIGRSHPDLQNTIGMFASTLLLRNYPSSEKTFKEFLQEVKRRLIEVFENQDFPYEELVEKLVPIREANKHPITVIGFSLQEKFDISFDIPGLAVKSYPIERITAKTDLSLLISEIGEGLRFSIEYCSSLFKTQTIDRFINYFKEMVHFVIHHMDEEINNIKISHNLSSVKSRITKIDFSL